MRPYERVAVGGPGFVVQMIVLLAAEAAGAVTVSFVAEGDPDAAVLFEQVRHVIAAMPQDPAGRGIPRTPRCVLQALRAAPSPGQVDWTPPAWDAPHRMVRTSGSTGASKFMVLARGTFEYRLVMRPPNTASRRARSAGATSPPALDALMGAGGR